jgi:hypothetical protein
MAKRRGRMDKAGHMHVSSYLAPLGIPLCVKAMARTLKVAIQQLIARMYEENEHHVSHHS